MAFGRGRIGRRRRATTGGRVPAVAVAVGLLMGVVLGLGYLTCSPRRPTSIARPTTASNVAVVRVRVLARADEAKLVVDGVPRVVRAADVAGGGGVTFKGTPTSAIAVNGRRYRGDVRVVPSPEGGGAVDAIDVVSIDEYLAGVVPSEAYPNWPIEALKAQAIAARTYALFQVQSRPDRDARAWDLYADVRSQAYGGIDAETDATNRAVDETRGVVLASGARGDERIFCAYFSSTCGGATASGADVFADETPALAAHVSDGCTDAPRYRWPEFAIRKDELARRVRIWGQRQNSPIANVGRIRTVEVAQKNELGRPVRFAVADEEGKRYELAAEHFRNACNADRPEKSPEFFSSFFVPVDAGDSVRITEGKGWGHGVGLCQYCTATWARRGRTFTQILSASYPGAALVRAY